MAENNVDVAVLMGSDSDLPIVTKFLRFLMILALNIQKVSYLPIELITK